MKKQLLLATLGCIWVSTLSMLAQTNQLFTPRYYSATPQVSADLDSMPKKKRVDLLGESTIDYSGLASKVFKARKSSDIAQLFNPFASASYGTPAWASRVGWRPFDGNRPLPHAFTDPITHEPPGIVLISVNR
jgi:hypothetical protein